MILLRLPLAHVDVGEAHFLAKVENVRYRMNVRILIVINMRILASAEKHTNGCKSKSAPSSEHILNAFLC